jgi:hypothetical protein
MNPESATAAETAETAGTRLPGHDGGRGHDPSPHLRVLLLDRLQDGLAGVVLQGFPSSAVLHLERRQLGRAVAEVQLVVGEFASRNPQEGIHL